MAKPGPRCESQPGKITQLVAHPAFRGELRSGVAAATELRFCNAAQEIASNDAESERRLEFKL